MKILVIVQEYLPKSQTFVFDQIEVLRQEHEVQILALQMSEDPTFPDQGVSLIPRYLGWRGRIRKILHDRYIFWLLRDEASAHFIREKVKMFSPELVIVHFGDTAVHFVAQFDSLPCPLAVFIHGFDGSMLLRQGVGYARAVERLLEFGVQFHFVSQGLRGHMEDKLLKTRSSIAQKINSNNWQVSYLGIPSRKKIWDDARPNMDEDPIRFLQFSRLVEKKGHELSIRALHALAVEMPDRQFEFHIVGDGPLTGALIDLSESLSLDNFSCIFHGWREASFFQEIAARCHAYVHHSVPGSDGNLEGLPISILEALDHGLPVFASDQTGIPEVLEELHGCQVCTSGDIQLYIAQLKSFVFSKENIEIMLPSKFEIRNCIDTFLRRYLTKS